MDGCDYVPWLVGSKEKEDEMMTIGFLRLSFRIQVVVVCVYVCINVSMICVRMV